MTKSPTISGTRNRHADDVLAALGDAEILGANGAAVALGATAVARPLDEAGNQDAIALQLQALACDVDNYATGRARGNGWRWGPVFDGSLNVLHGVRPPDGRPVAELLAMALQMTPAGGGRTALAVVVEACGLALPVEPFRPIKRASLPALQRVTEPLRELPAIQASPTEPQLLLPGFTALTNHGAASWLLALYDQAGGELMRQGRGAPWDLRLFVAALLHVHIKDRTGAPVQLPFRLPEIVSWLHPDGWANRRRDWDRLPEALDRIGSLRVPMPFTHPNGETWTGRLAMVQAALAVDEWNPEAVVLFTVTIPAQAARGARIEWPRLLRYGKESAALYRAYLSVCALLDKSARHGHSITRQIAAPVLGADELPVRRKGGRIKRDGSVLIDNPSARFVPTFTDHDLAEIIGFDAGNRDHRYKARSALEQLANDGVIEIERVGRCGIRLFQPQPPPADGVIEIEKVAPATKQERLVDDTKTPAGSPVVS